MPTSCSVITLRGELSESTRAQTLALLAEALSGLRTGLIIDVSHVTFIDTQGMQMLVTCLRTMAERGGLLTLVGLRPEPLLIFELLGARQVFHLFATVDEARAFLLANAPVRVTMI
jgi:anti-anti-sigma factor